MMNNTNEDDYYESISDSDDDGIDFGEEQQCSTYSNGQYHFGNKGLIEKNNASPFDFEDLPFVPKFSSEIRNTVEAAKNSENDISDTPLVGDWSSSVNTISNSQNSSINSNCPYFPNQPNPSVAPPIPDKCSNSNSQANEETENSLKTTIECSKANPLSAVSSSHESSIIVDANVNLNSELENGNLFTSSAKVGSETSVNVSNPNWADENGDPIQGAFDNFQSSATSELCTNIVNNTKVEYVFHVKEKKSDDFIKSDSGVGSVSEVVPQGCVISSLANLVPNSDPVNDSETKTFSGDIPVPVSVETSDEYDQKKLYEASKNKNELCKTTSENENIASTSSESGVKNVFPNKKFDQFLFKRNNFINQRKCDEVSEDVAVGAVTNDPNKCSGDKALESQALNELLKEVKQGAERARNYGALGWQKQPVPVVNKRFLLNTLASTLREPYKPPGRRGRFHQGLQGDRHSDSSSGSSSRSSRSSSSGSYSRSSSRSRGSRSRSRSHDKKHRRNKGGPPPPNAFYDWAAMGQYGGYPWMDPSMYYGMENYPQMYYNDPQFWAAYRDFYGMGGGPGFDPTFHGRGQPRGRGWWGQGRGRGRGGFGGMGSGEKWSDHEQYSDSPLSRSRSGSPRSRGRSGSPRSKGRNVSPRSRGRSGSPRSRGRSGSPRSGGRSGSPRSMDRCKRSHISRSENKHGSKQGHSSECEGSDNSKSKGKKKKTSSRSTSKTSDKSDDKKMVKNKGKKKKKKHKGKNDDRGGKGNQDSESFNEGGNENKTEKGDENCVKTGKKRKSEKDDADCVKVIKKKKPVGGMKSGPVVKKVKGGTNLKGMKTKGKELEGSSSCIVNDEAESVPGKTSDVKAGSSESGMSSGLNTNLQEWDRKDQDPVGKKNDDNCHHEDGRKIKSKKYSKNSDEVVKDVNERRSEGLVKKNEDCDDRIEQGRKVIDSEPVKERKSDDMDRHQNKEWKRSRGGKEYNDDKSRERGKQASDGRKFNVNDRKGGSGHKSSHEGEANIMKVDNIGRKTKKIEEIERRLQERKAKRKLEEDSLRQNDCPRGSSNDRIGVRVDPQQTNDDIFNRGSKDENFTDGVKDFNHRPESEKDGGSKSKTAGNNDVKIKKIKKKVKQKSKKGGRTDDNENSKNVDGKKKKFKKKTAGIQKKSSNTEKTKDETTQVVTGVTDSGQETNVGFT